MFQYSAGMDDGVIASFVKGSGSAAHDHKVYGYSMKLHSRGIINVKVIKGHDQTV
jgi:hypothetical protein